MGIHNIEKKSFGYSLLKSYGKWWHDKIFYNKVVYRNTEKVPLNDHLIFTANHQNALMDALAIGYSIKKQFVFVARSDIFKNKIIAQLLYFLKILPVYRIRDGYDSLKKNKEIFQKTLDVINNKNGFVIMPEGNHASFRKLRPFKKGFARIAFQAEEAVNFSLDVKIIPVGINYSNYEKYRQDLLVNFGSPLSLSPFYQEYKNNPAKALNLVKAALSDSIRPLMIDIKSEKFYDTYNFSRTNFAELFCQKKGWDFNDLSNRFLAEKQIIKILEEMENNSPSLFSEFSKNVNSVIREINLQKLNFRDVYNKKPSKINFTLKSAVLIIFSPVFIYGYLNHFFPYYLPVYASKKVKDPQFRSSFKYALSMFLFPLFYFGQTLLEGFIFSFNWITIGYIITLPFFGAFSWKYSRIYLKNLKLYRLLQWGNLKNSNIKSVNKKISYITNQIDYEITKFIKEQNTIS